MLKNPFDSLSIIMPVFNAESFIGDKLKCLFSEVPDQAEIIIIDDGSTDASLSIIKKCIEGRRNVTLISQPNGGLSRARNSGLVASTREYVVFLDCDDEIDGYSLIYALSSALNLRVDILCCDYIEFDEFGSCLKSLLGSEFKAGSVYNGAFALEWVIRSRKRNYTIVCRNIFRRDFLLGKKLFFKDGLRHEDMLFTPQSWVRAERVAFSEFAFYLYLRRPASLSNGTVKPAAINDLIFIHDELKSAAKNNVCTSSRIVFEMFSQLSAYHALSRMLNSGAVDECFEMLDNCLSRLKFTSNCFSGAQRSLILCLRFLPLWLFKAFFSARRRLRSSGCSAQGLADVLMFADFLEPYYTGGSVRHATAVSSELIRNYNAVVFSRPYDKASPYRIDSTYAPKVGHVLFSRVFGIAPCVKVMRSLRQTALIGQHPILSFLPFLVGSFLGRRIVYTFHGPLHLEFLQKVGGRLNLANGFRFVALWFIQWVVLKCSTVVFVHSQFMGIEAKRAGCPRNKLRLLPPIVNEAVLAASSRLTNRENVSFLDSETVKIFCPRRLTRRTGVIDFCARVVELSDLKSFRPIELVISGTGELSGVVTNSHENIKFVGFVSDASLIELVKNSHIVALPSLSLEGFGYVIIEALSMSRIPMVSKLCGGGRDFLALFGFDNLFDVQNASSIGEAVSRSLDLYSDPVLEDVFNYSRGFTINRMFRFYQREMFYSF